MKLSLLLSSTLAVVPALAQDAPSEQPAPGTRRTVALTEDVSLELVWIPPGRFLMGSPSDEAGRSYSFMPADRRQNLPDYDAEHQHEVVLTRGYWLGRTEVTQRQWLEVMEHNPSRVQGSDQPVTNVNWFAVQQFLERASLMLDEGVLRLPREAEWEYAARAGTGDAYAGDIDALGWTRRNSGGHPHPVGTREANAWGVHDMHGNVTEWCADWYGPYPDGPVSDPIGVDAETADSEANGLGRNRRVARGGSFTGRVLHCRCADRGAAPPGKADFYRGFRFVWVPDERD